MIVCTFSCCHADDASISSAIEDCIDRTPLVPCPPSIYRSTSGECNSINQRSWGARGDTFLRIFDPSYGNTVNSPRKSVLDDALPPAVNVLEALRSNLKTSEVAPHITSLLPLWGHLIFRDIAHFNTYSTNSTCCTEDEINPHCFVERGKNCKEYTRTMAKQEVKNCKFGKFLCYYLLFHL